MAIYDGASLACYDCTINMVIQDPHEYGIDINLKNFHPYPVPPPLLPVFGLPQDQERIKNYRNNDLLFLLRGSIVRRDLEPSLMCIKAINYDEEDMEEMFEDRYGIQEVPKSEYDSDVMYMIENGSEDKKILYRFR
ncbi:hypothetical protein Tco_0595050 [Tanacetum coccineum]